MIQHIFELTDAQDAILNKLAADSGRSVEDVIDEQVLYYFKRMLISEFGSMTKGLEDLDITDAQKIELAIAKIQAAKNTEDAFLIK